MAEISGFYEAVKYKRKWDCSIIVKNREINWRKLCQIKINQQKKR